MIKPVERRLRQENDQEEERNMVKTIGNTLDLCSHGTVASLLHRLDNLHGEMIQVILSCRMRVI